MCPNHIFKYYVQNYMLSGWIIDSKTRISEALKNSRLILKVGHYMRLYPNGSQECNFTITALMINTSEFTVVALKGPFFALIDRKLLPALSSPVH